MQEFYLKQPIFPCLILPPPLDFLALGILQRCLKINIRSPLQVIENNGITTITRLTNEAINKKLTRNFIKTSKKQVLSQKGLVFIISILFFIVSYSCTFTFSPDFLDFSAAKAIKWLSMDFSSVVFASPSPTSAL